MIILLVIKILTQNDITPEINNTVARNVVTSLIIAYMHRIQNRPTGPDMWWLADYILVTMRIVDPIVDAFKMEGFYHFKPPCSSNPQLNPANCTQGKQKTILNSNLGSISSI